ncbi:MAG: DNA replication/repair protein RecF [Tissierellia bacterium]|nr:DNA replication/repair protein RecF [Tissierellia bacterium]
MNVKNLRLINFRNYNNVYLELDDKLNIFIGKNAQGKTNLLEAIYVSATGKSFRTNRDRELINFNKKEAYIGSKVQIGEREKLIEIKLDRIAPKRIKINKLELKKQKELNSGLNVVVFSPDDLSLVKGSPKERRLFLDTSISQVKPVYRYNLNRYNKILIQRNNLLKAGKSKKDLVNLLDIFDMQLVKTGTDIIISRFNFIDKLSKVALNIHNRLTLNKEKLLLNYDSSISFKNLNRQEIESSFIKSLKENRYKDMLTGSTSTGPHRDDMKIYINNMDSRTFASQGQQRTIVLTIKLSEVEIIYKDTGSYPVLLLDDVFSELDSDRRKYLISFFKNTQTFITSTDIENLDELMDSNPLMFTIENGNIKYKE